MVEVLPLFLQAWLEGYARMSYSKVQLTNWIWTMEEVGSGDVPLVSTVPMTVVALAGAIFLLNLVFTMFEVEQTRAATPQRVLQDDRELHPEKAPQPVRRSPWDAAVEDA